MSSMKFIGADLGWVSGATGLCCLEWHAGQLHLLALDCLMPMSEILAWVDQWLPACSPGMVAVDAPTQITKDGSPVGNMISVDVDQNGFVQATFDIGITRTVYQIPLVDLPNPNGLQALDNQTYQTTRDSGSFFLWDAADGPTGDIIGFALEESATDVAGELTQLIQTQRAYSSNAKVIQTVDEMLQETTNIKR